MKHTINTASAVATLLCLALAGQAAAQPQSTDPADAPLSEYENLDDVAETQAGEEELQMTDEPAAEALSDELSSATTEEEDGTEAASGIEESGREQFKSKLKRMLLGVLLPAVERRMRKAIDGDSDDGRDQPVAEDEQELASEQ